MKDRIELKDNDFEFSAKGTHHPVVSITISEHGQQRQVKQEILENQLMRLKLVDLVNILYSKDTPIHIGGRNLVTLLQDVLRNDL